MHYLPDAWCGLIMQLAMWHLTHCIRGCNELQWMKATVWRICIPSLGACLKSKQWTSDFFWLYVSPFSYLRVNSLFFWVCITKNMPFYGCKLILVVGFSFRFAGMDKIIWIPVSLNLCRSVPLPPPLCLPISDGEGFPSCKWCATSLKF